MEGLSRKLLFQTYFFIILLLYFPVSNRLTPVHYLLNREDKPSQEDNENEIIHRSINFNEGAASRGEDESDPIRGVIIFAASFSSFSRSYRWMGYRCRDIENVV